MSTEDTIANLPDLSAFGDDEKQHILDVLVRDENLRNKHLSRFMQLRKEVADLEQQSHETSTSICARCHTPFGYIFNTGDSCPKCAAKVCRQCRLMYNVNDNGWLCQLCCKQMQLMSYSGEWVYSIRSNLRKDSSAPSEPAIDSSALSEPAMHSSAPFDPAMDSSAPSEPVVDSLPPSATLENSTILSSSDSDLESLNLTTKKPPRFQPIPVSSKRNDPKPTRPKNALDKMIVQNEIDEQKLNFVKDHIENRPTSISFTQPLPRRFRQQESKEKAGNSSSDEDHPPADKPSDRQDQTSSKQTLSTLKDTQASKTNLTETLKSKEPASREVDCQSVTASERNSDDGKSKNARLSVEEQRPSSIRGSKLSIASNATEKSSRKHLNVSMQSLRDVVLRMKHPSLSSSRTSLHTDSKRKSQVSNSSTINNEDAASSKAPDLQSRATLACALYSIMTEFYHHDVQQTKLTHHSSLFTRSTMPSFQSGSKHRTFLSKHLSDNEDDPHSIHKEELITQIFHHWKMKTLEHQHALNNPQNTTTSNHFSQVFHKTAAPTETSSEQVLSNNEVPNNTEPVTPIVALKKRTKPPPLSYARRKPILKKSHSAPEGSGDPNLLSPNAVAKCATAALNIRRPPTAGPIFIAPKKTQPSLVPRSYFSHSPNETAKTKRSTPVFERQNATSDDPITTPISPTWVPAPPMTPTRFFAQSSISSLDTDDESSDDETQHESLLIRSKKDLKKSINTAVEQPFFTHSNLIVPTAVFITDPSGDSRAFNLNRDILEGSVDMDSFVDGLIIGTTRILSNTNPAFNPTSPLIAGGDLSTSPILLNQYILHSIGEEEENDSTEEDHVNENIRPKKHKRLDRHNQSPQTNATVQTKRNDEDQPRKDLQTLERRWSDGLVDEDEEQLRKPRPLIVKMASATSIMKQPASSPAKVSIKKYLMMKLHLVPSPSVDKYDSNTLLAAATADPPPRKHSRSTLRSSELTLNESKRPSTISRHDSTHTTDSQTADEVVSITAANSIHEIETETVSNHGVTPVNEDQIDGRSVKSKVGSQSSINSTFTEAKANYDLNVTGTIAIKLSYNVKTSAMDILIKNCTNLARAKRGHASNPYCKIYLLPDKSKNSKRKTAAVRNTTDPVFDETLRYYLNIQDFDTRVLWFSVWSQSSIGSNDFLGEVHIPLDNCSLDRLEEYTLLARAQEETVIPGDEPTTETNQLYFELNFLANQINKEVGTIQVAAVHAKGIYHGKHPVDAICKGMLMPDRIKRKLPTVRKGPSPKWDIPFRWDQIRLKKLDRKSIEISIWSQERFRKTLIGFVRLNALVPTVDNQFCQGLETTKAEKTAWKTFLEDPTKVHRFHLPLRSSATHSK